MPTMTKDQYDSGLDRIMDKYERLPRTLTEADHTNLNLELALFKRSAVIVETTAPARAPARPSRPAARSSAAKLAKQEKRRRRIVEAVHETLTAAGAPKPPPGRTPQVAPRAVTPDVPLHQLDADQLDGMARSLGAAGASPFWRQLQESTAAAPVTESVTEAEQTARDLASLTGEGLDAVLAGVNRRRALRSPFWAA
jgi:hypothetical protein